MKPLVSDLNERLRALDAKHSFIVQAPAGSGKTELLIQRFLVLLCEVKQPEEILSITFTNKSAAEMRTRIIKALQRGKNDPLPQEDHQKRTWELAKKVLQQDEFYQWNILDNPNRLRIQTIDAFNCYLTHSLPILSRFGASPEITDQPLALYREAVESLLLHINENFTWTPALAALMLHLDNDAHQVSDLLMAMLARRDQWLPYLKFQHNEVWLREQLEKNLATLSVDLLKKLRSSFPREITSQLMKLAHFAANNLLREGSTSPITIWASLDNLPSVDLKDKPYWQALGELLLTKEFHWRKRFDKSVGFPPASQFKNKEEKLLYTTYKEDMVRLIEIFTHLETCRIYFQELLLSPKPYYEEHQWEVLKNLLHILPPAIAELHLVFQQHGKIDYIENAEAALLALGQEDSPTDLTLALDYQIKHILIDEFQDTSTTQCRLLEKLTAGWEAGDGRTLFIVGDPMQSIYRFREAEVGLFIRCREHGLNGIVLHPLTLRVNFRSSATIVHWINQHFKKILSEYDDIATGSISFKESIAKTHVLEDDSGVQCYNSVSTDAHSESQDQAIVDLILKRKYLYPTETIAILVRSRTHLTGIVNLLKENNITFKAVDIDPLRLKPHIQDLLALTFAMLYPADRISWLAILRAPWCGLSLSDLLIIAAEPYGCLYERLDNPEIIAKLSEEGKIQLQRVWPIFKKRIQERYRLSLRALIENTWRLLGGPACIKDIMDLEDTKAFFYLLEQIEIGGDLKNITDLHEALHHLYSSPNLSADNSLQIMTIHSAKGLEFDTVILPHLERQGRKDSKSLLLWAELAQDSNERTLIMAPLHALDDKNDSIYQYLKRLQTIKMDHETARLLYVAATRAKKNLHLFFSTSTPRLDDYQPPPNTLLHKLWPTIGHEIITLPITLNVVSSAPSTPQGIRLIGAWQNPLQELPVKNSYHQGRLGFQLPDIKLKTVGTFIHWILQQISILGISWWQDKTLEQKNRFVYGLFQNLAFNDAEITVLSDKIKLAINNALQDPKGRWILQAHPHAKSEWKLTANFENTLHAFIIDRTFIDENGIRWIIDYKTAYADKEKVEIFLEEAQAKYHFQLSQYAKALSHFEEPIRIGLYFPMLPAWKEWEYRKE